MDVKIAKELSEKYSKKVNDKNLKYTIRSINIGIKKRCKQGFSSYSYMAFDLKNEVKEKVVENYSNKGFEAELVGNRIFIKW